MDTEIELKLIVPENAGHIIEQQLLPKLDAQVEQHQANLYNQYFDTPEQALRQADIGMRVRGVNGRFEQTIKTAGKVVGGLHQRPEYNIPLQDNQPDLSLFPEHIWPENTDVSLLQQQIAPLFTTHFLRSSYKLTLTNGTQIELVFDQGEVLANGRKQAICEVELELLSGNAGDIFDVAEALMALCPCRLGQQSKAARGYMLAKGKELEGRELPRFLELTDNVDVETGLCQALETLLSQWLHQEACYLDSTHLKDLRRLNQALAMLEQTMQLYAPLLGAEVLQQCQQSLTLYRQRWHWLEGLLAIKGLRSKKGPYQKRLGKSPELLSYLHGRQQGILQQYQPEQILLTGDGGKVQLALSKLLWQKPWRELGDAWQAPLQREARECLKQRWQSVAAALPGQIPQSVSTYMSNEGLIRQALYEGFLLANVFSDKPDQFRAPWLDILDGIEELRMLQSLQLELPAAGIEDTNALMAWSQEKLQALWQVMEQSRNAALQQDVYW